MLVRRYEMPWRPAYEGYAALTWGLALIYAIAAASTSLLPRPLAWPLAVFCTALAARRLSQGLRILVLRAGLAGRAIEKITPAELARCCPDPQTVFLGFGFEWRPVHAQRLYELAKIDYRDVALSPRLLAWLGYHAPPQPDAEIGLPYIHGVEPKEGAL